METTLYLSNKEWRIAKENIVSIKNPKNTFQRVSLEFIDMAGGSDETCLIKAIYSDPYDLFRLGMFLKETELRETPKKKKKSFWHDDDEDRIKETNALLGKVLEKTDALIKVIKAKNSKSGKKKKHVKV